MSPKRINFLIFCGFLVALTGCQSRPKPMILSYDQLDEAQRQAITAYYTPEAVKAREEERQGRQRQWGDAFSLQTKREAEEPPSPQIQHNTIEDEARRNDKQRKSRSDSGCNCRVKPFKAVKRAFGL